MKAETDKASHDFVWQGADYPSIEAGAYLVRGVKIQGPEWCKRWNRWSLRVEFALAHQSVSVSAFFNLGNNPAHPRPGRHSRYWKAWTLANGEPPRRGQSMSPEIFLEGQFFRARIDHVHKNDDGTAKRKAESYSRIVELISVERV